MLYASIAVIFNKENKVLVLKRSPGVDTFAEHWCFPGGIANDGEGSVECAVRETFEETSLKLKPEFLVYFYTIKKDGDKNIDFYIANDWKGKVTLDWESSEYKWVEPEELESIQFIPAQEKVFRLIKMWDEVSVNQKRGK